MKNPVLKWERVGDVFVVLSGRGAVPDELWSAWLKDLETLPLTRYLGVSVGSIDLTSLQRKQGTAVIKARKILTAVVTDDRFVRGLVTAVSWLGGEVKAFSMADLDDSFTYLRISETLQPLVLESIQRLRGDVS